MDKDIIIPKVSIIMPAYNVESYIEASINSVLNQTFKDWELIIIDDGSIDLTSEILKKYELLDKRIHYIYQENSKQARARNNGIRIARASIIAFLDSDDLWMPNKLEVSLLHFDTNKFDLLFTDAYYGGNLEIDASVLDLKKMKIPDSEYFGKNAIADFIAYNRIPTLTVLVKKNVLAQVNFFDEQFVLAEDFDLWLRLLKADCRFKSVKIPLSIYRFQTSSSTANDRLAIDWVLKVIIKNFSYKELEELNAQSHVKIWIKRWIVIYLNRSSVNQLKEILSYFNEKNAITNVAIYGYNLLGLKIFKRIILKTI
jgi:teichuronic acid biosynthesis glycosyltransferase TuaG